MTKILIIPDVHGRKFWIDAVEKFKDEVSDIVFLGDYLDPYAFEGIGKDSALERFKDIIELAKSNPKVHLLLGNHDWHYIVNLDTCRLDFENYKEIKDLFAENKDLFKIAWSYENYLFTHAGVTNSWLKHVQFYKSEFKPTPECLNNLEPRFLSEIGYERGGDDRNGGSCLWADIYEHLNYFKDPIENGTIYQIFGHSLAFPDLDNAYIDEHFAMLDSRNAWTLDTDTKKIVAYC